MVDTHLSAMMEGDLLTPSDAEPIVTIAGKQAMLQAAEQERLDVGFHYRSLDTGIVEGLAPGSRAEAAGLHNGDNILARGGSVEKCKSGLGMDFRFTVQRGEERLEGVYWPRPFAKVTSYQTVIIDGLAEAAEMWGFEKTD